jgi:hypothetical protein
MKKKYLDIETLNADYIIRNRDGSAIRMYHRLEDNATVIEFYEDSDEVDYALAGDVSINLDISEIDSLIKGLKKIKKAYEDHERELFMNSD